MMPLSPPLLKPLPYRGSFRHASVALYGAVQLYEEDTAVYVAPPSAIAGHNMGERTKGRNNNDLSTAKISYETEKMPVLDLPENNQAFAEERATMREDAGQQIPDESKQPRKRRRRIGPPRPDGEVSTRDLADPTMAKKSAPVVTVTTPTEEEGERIGKTVTKEDIARLNKEVNRLYEEVKNKLVATRQHSTQALSWLNEAHTIIVARPEQFLLAELRVHQTELLLKQVDFSQQAAKQYAIRLNLWNFAGLLILGTFFVFDGPITSRLLDLGWISPPKGFSAPEINSLRWYFQPWLTALAGGIGGTLTALIILGREVKARDYDPASNPDYYLNGLKGFIFGIVTYFILLGGFISSVASTTIGDEAAQLIQRVQIAGSPPFILFAFLAGFEQQRLLALLARIWGNLTGEADESASSAYDPSIEEAASAPMPVSSEAFSPDGNQGGPPMNDDFNQGEPPMGDGFGEAGPPMGDGFGEAGFPMGDGFGQGGPPMGDGFGQGGPPMSDGFGRGGQGSQNKS